MYEISKVNSALGIMYQVDCNYFDTPVMFWTLDEAREYVEYLKTL